MWALASMLPAGTAVISFAAIFRQSAPGRKIGGTLVAGGSGGRDRLVSDSKPDRELELDEVGSSIFRSAD